ncbi:MAG: chemotaxis protein CheW [Planctomycetota bacterium]|nr:chemotaxis protein CheW [Planctomycetota bacterium]MCX8040622.1 chemotaxis protein CheW [Planctomycetota bacterium]MDW8373774.1 chemotaxis protein CheW [Planctomycetota bacterium]
MGETATSITGKFLTFQVGNEEYGIAIQAVREIIAVLPITPVPGAPAHMMGVINLRGKVIPVLSMRARFGLPPAEPHPHQVIIVVDGQSGPVGLYADRVREVATFQEGDTEPPPSYGLQIDTSLVAALGKSQGRIRILLDIQRVLAGIGG